MPAKHSLQTPNKKQASFDCETHKEPSVSPLRMTISPGLGFDRALCQYSLVEAGAALLPLVDDDTYIAEGFDGGFHVAA